MSGTTLFCSSEPTIAVWDAKPLLASLIVHHVKPAVSVVEISSAAEFAGLDAKEREGSIATRVVLLIGSNLLRDADALRFLHRLHRTNRAMVVACGQVVDSAEALVAAEVGVAAIVQTLHDAICVGRAAGRFLAN